MTSSLVGHGHDHHGYTLHDHQVHTPMLARIPGAHVGKTLECPVASIDAAPTVRGTLGILVSESFQGVDRLAVTASIGDHFFIEYPT